MQLRRPRVPTDRRLTALIAVTAAGALILTASPSAADPAADVTPAHYLVTGPQTFEDVDAIARTGAAVDDIEHGDVYVTAIPSEVAAIRALGFEVDGALPQIPDAHGSIQDYPPGYDGYHNFGELVDMVDQLVSDHPQIAQRVEFGSSYQGRDLFAVKISDNVAAEEGEPEVLLNSNQHAREHLTVEMAIYLMEMFTDEYGSDPRITELVDERVIWIVPSVNPDGAEYDIATGSFRSWRKNRQPNSGTSAVGTDLNRNWGYQWGGSGSSGNPGSQTYRGPAPFSGAETAALRDFVLSRVIGGEQMIKANIDFHTYSELVLWPYGYTFSDIAPGLDADAAATFQAIGEEMAGTNGYAPMQASDLYLVSGGAMDWMWADQGIFAYAFELYPSSAAGGGFYPPDSVIAAETARNREAVLRLVEYADCPWRAIGEQQQYCGQGGGGGQTVYSDDFETSAGWTVNPSGSDTATAGQWERAAPQATSWNGLPLQLGTTTSGTNALVTGAQAGSSVGSNDIDGGATSARSPVIALPAQGDLSLTLSLYLAHLDNASGSDYLRVSVVHSGGTTVLIDRPGAATNQGGSWSTASADLDPYAGQDIRLLIETADAGSGSLVEAAVDDVEITVSGNAFVPSA